MKRFNDSKISMVLFVFAAVTFLDVSVKADFTFGEPVNLGPVVNGPSSNELLDCVSPDGLEMYISSNRAEGGYGGYDLWVLKRTTIDADWGPLENLRSTVNSPQDDFTASISADGLTLCFTSTRPGGYGEFDIYLTRRATKNSPWDPAVNLSPPINGSATDVCCWISRDGLEFYFGSYRAGGRGACDIYVAGRATESDSWGSPVNIGPVVNSAYEDQFPSLSPDGLLLFFSDHNVGFPRPGGYGSSDMYVSRRPTTQGSWGAPVNLGPLVNGPCADHCPRVSPDGRILYFGSLDRPGGYGGWDIWQSPIIPIVDFTGDEIVDINDLVILIDNWETDSNLCDIGPMPWGDGKVDENDLKVLMSYWGQEVEFLPFDLIAYWRLDETEGDTASDSVSSNDGTVHGGPLWQPEGGIVKGALSFDGINDYVSTPFVLNPYFGPFSVFAWIKSDAAGKVILSQKTGANWLLTNSSGKLSTELKASGTSGQTLLSQAIITDGNWHRIGFVRDGTSRILYVDDVEVARDIQTSIAGSGQGLYIGAGKGLESGKFFSGLIDDVRIYDRALSP